MAVSFGRKGGIGASSKKQQGAAKKPVSLKSFLDEECEREKRIARQESSDTVLVQDCREGRPRVYLEVAIFRGSFFGVDYQDVLEFELYPDVAPEAVKHLMLDCASGKLQDLAFERIGIESAALPQVATHDIKVIGKGLSHDQSGMLSVSRHVDGSGVLLTLKAMPKLDKDRVGFARLLKGDQILRRIADCCPIDGVPVKEVRIVSCGEALASQPEKKEAIRRQSEHSGGAQRVDHARSRSRRGRRS